MVRRAATATATAWVVSIKMGDNVFKAQYYQAGSIDTLTDSGGSFNSRGFMTTP